MKDNHAGETPGVAEVVSVSALNRFAREMLERGFPLLWVAGEVSNLTRATSGHVYFSLKDEAAQVRCVMFRNRAQIVPFRLGEGMRVEARALVTLYEARGDFQLNVEALRQAGIGALYEAFTRLRGKLENEGLFAQERKLPLPNYPKRIGVVTSPQAAALRDILAALRRRSPHLPLVIYPVPVQGTGAAAMIAAAVQSAGLRGECDVLIVARGGGSIEDLWSFNEEIVARAIDACPIPVIAGIGHETDTTIADLVADRRAATPTAAAELASAGYFEAQRHLEKLGPTLRDAMRRTLEGHMQRLDLLGRSLMHPGERLARLRAEVSHLGTRIAGSLRLQLGRSAAALQQSRSRLDAARPDLLHVRRDLRELDARLRAVMAAALDGRRTALGALATNLAHLRPDAVLLRGYSITRKSDGSIVHSSEQLVEGEALRLTFGHGWAGASVTGRGDA